MSLENHPVLANALVKLGLMKDKEDGADNRPATGPEVLEGSSTTEVVKFHLQLDKALARHRQDLGDRTYLISLSKLKENLGERWNELEKNARLVLKAEINNAMAHDDISVEFDDLSYLVVFPDLGPREAQLKCTAISEAILERIIGREQISEMMDIRKVTPLEDGSTEFESLPDFREIVESTVNEIGQMRKNQDVDVSHQANGSSGYLHGVQFIFRPLLTMKSKIVSTFLCVPIRPGARGTLSGYDVLQDPQSPAQIFDLDRETVKLGVRAINDITRTKKRSLLALPVHFETLANHQRQIEYISLIEDQLSGFQKRLVFEIVALPDGIPQARLTELVTALHPHSRAVMARFSLDHSSFPGFRTGGLHAVGVDLYNSSVTEASVMTQMEAFVSNAHKNNLKTYVLGIHSISLYTATVTEGFDYLAGHALTAASSEAGDISAFSMGMPFKKLGEPADQQ